MSPPYLFRPDALPMLMLRNPAAAHAPKFDDLAAAVRREAESAEAEPFDDARMADVVSIADALRAESTELEVLRGRMVRLARQVPR